MSNFFKIENLTCGYENKFHITNINISISKGTLVGIIGPNGCGKTTLFRGITGELKNKTGMVTLNGIKLHNLSFKERARKLAIVTQYNDAPQILVEDYVLMGRLPFYKSYQFFDTKEDNVIAQKYMALTGISHLKNKCLSSLSGGEQQLVSITRALVQEPELLLLDEPTSHLDIMHQAEVMDLVQQFNEQLGITVIMIIHDLNLAGEYCNKLVLMHKGSIRKIGAPEEVLTYENIENVFGTLVVTKPNPLSGKPAVFLVSNKVLNELRIKN